MDEGHSTLRWYRLLCDYILEESIVSTKDADMFVVRRATINEVGSGLIGHSPTNVCYR